MTAAPRKQSRRHDRPRHRRSVCLGDVKGGRVGPDEPLPAPWTHDNDHRKNPVEPCGIAAYRARGTRKAPVPVRRHDMRGRDGAAG